MSDSNTVISNYRSGSMKIIVIFSLLFFVESYWKIDTEASPTTTIGPNFVHPGAISGISTFTHLRNKTSAFFFGGSGSAGDGVYDQLWSYNFETETWSLLSGSNISANVDSVYGTKNTYSKDAHLGSRVNSGGWVSFPDGNEIFLFGGTNSGYFADLWSWSLSKMQWRWIGGSVAIDTLSLYPPLGSCGDQSLYFPGGRERFATFLDPNNPQKLYFYGGRGMHGSGFDELDQFWYFDLNIQQFCFINGTTGGGVFSTHHVKGDYHPGNNPGKRQRMAFWVREIDATDTEFCMFGGGDDVWNYNHYNDIFCWSTSRMMWKWVSGEPHKNVHGEFAEYYSANAHPGSRWDPQFTFVDNRYLYIFGGYGYATVNCDNHLLSPSCLGPLCDFWVYDFSQNMWKALADTLEARDITQWDFVHVNYYHPDNYPTARSHGFMHHNHTHIVMFGGSSMRRRVNTDFICHSAEVLTYFIESLDESYVPECNSISASHSYVCSGNGRCVESYPNDYCDCFFGYSGADCELIFCHNDTNPLTQCNYPHGNCVRSNICNCTEPYHGITCTETFDNSTIRCISRCEDDESINNLMTFSANPFSFHRNNFIGSRRTEVIFEKNDLIYFWGGGHCMCTDTTCSESIYNDLHELNYYNDMWIYSIELDQYRIHSDSEVGGNPMNGPNDLGTYIGTSNLYPSARMTKRSNIFHNEFVIFGGENRNSLKADLWKFSLVTEQWSLIYGDNSDDHHGITPSGYGESDGRIGARADNAIWFVQNKAYVYGGTTNYASSVTTFTSDMWEYDVDSGLWTYLNGDIMHTSGNLVLKNVYSATTIPPARRSPAYWHVGDELFMYGGEGHCYLNDLISFSIAHNKTYTHLFKYISGQKKGLGVSHHGKIHDNSDFHKNNRPAGRSGPAFLHIFNPLESDNLLIIYGGFGMGNNYLDIYGGYLNDIWIYSHSRDMWKYYSGSEYKDAPGKKYVFNDLHVELDYPRGAKHSVLVRGSNGNVYLKQGRISWWQKMSEIWRIKESEFITQLPPYNFDVVVVLVVVILLSIVFCLIFMIVIFFVMFLTIIKKKTKSKLGPNNLDVETDNRPLDDLHESQKYFKKFVDSDLMKISFQDILLKKQIGKGGSDSTVYLGDWNGQECCVKLFKTLSFVSGDNNYDEFEKEVKVISSISHPNIIRYYGSTIKVPKIGIILEYCANGDLRDFVMKKAKEIESFSVKVKKQILRGICLGMEYLHDRNIIHRDLKSSNVLLNDSLMPKIIDFGLSRVMENMASKDKTRRIGTKNYMAPEIITSSTYTEKVDVFSFSIIIFEVLEENMNPYGLDVSNHHSAVELKVANNPSFRPKMKKEKEHPKELVEVMKECWNHNPEKRPSFKNMKKIFK